MDPVTQLYLSTQSETVLCLRPYHVENTGSRPITEVKQHRAWLVLRWVTAWEHHVLQTFFLNMIRYGQRLCSKKYPQKQQLSKGLLFIVQKGTQKSIPFKTTNYACGIYIEQVLIICVHFSSRDLFLSRVVRCYFQKGQSFFNLVFSIVTLIIKQTNRITSKCLFRPMHCYIIDVLLVMSSQHRFP